MRNILVGFDKSRSALIAVSQATALASGLGARMHILQAVEQVGPGSELDLSPEDDPVAHLDRLDAMMTEPEAPLAADDDLAPAVRICEDAKVVCTHSRRNGMAVRVLREECLAMDLLVLGRRGTIGRKVVGSTATTIVSRPIVPTLLCRDTEIPWRRALVAYEVSANGGRALKVAGELASALNMGLDVVVADVDRERGRKAAEYAGRVLRGYHLDGEFVQHQGRIAEALQSAALQFQSSVVVVPDGRNGPWPWSRSEAVLAAIEFPTALALVVP
jgi:nucleotide-binding universal stress UspA family protein